ncbi:MAG: RloB family protein [Spirochaetaceae bacterium]|nr:RloB family protein [Spirochaetaceae bacterium]
MARHHRRRERPAPNLKRRRSQREPKRRFLLYCEGKNTEPAYFEAIKSTCASTLIAVEVTPGVGVPYTIAKRAVQRARAEGLVRGSRRSRDSFEENDQVWAVFDRDEHPRFDEAIALCDRHGVLVGRSNPCFELWLILHERDHDRFEHRDEMQAILERLRPEYDKDGGKTPDCDELVSRVQDAERRADVLLRRRRESGDPYGNPSTTVSRLTREIREADESARR